MPRARCCPAFGCSRRRLSLSATLRCWAAMSCAAMAAAPNRWPATLDATGIAPNARARQPGVGLMPDRPICCRSSMTTWSSRCRRPLPGWPNRARPWSTASCSTWPPRCCKPLPPIRSAWAQGSAPPWCCTAGARRLRITPMGSASCPAAGSAPTVRREWRAVRVLPVGARAVAAVLHRNHTKQNGLPCANTCKPLIYLVAWGGIEPPTRGFSIRCSTN